MFDDCQTFMFHTNGDMSPSRAKRKFTGFIAALRVKDESLLREMNRCLLTIVWGGAGNPPSFYWVDEQLRQEELVRATDAFFGKADHYFCSIN